MSCVTTSSAILFFSFARFHGRITHITARKFIFYTRTNKRKKPMLSTRLHNYTIENEYIQTFMQ